jgi:tetratricopeptide (TPR) repeat protein
MCSASSASTWPRRASALAIAALLVAHAVAGQGTADGAPSRARGTDIEQAWFGLAQVMEAGDATALKERTDELLRIGSQIGLRRLTPLSLALVARARGLQPPAADTVLRQAVRLDPSGAEAWFALSSVSFQRLGLGSGFSSLSRGIYALFTDQRLAHVVGPSLTLSVAVGLLFALALLGLASIQKVVPLLWHDLLELGTQLRLGPNGPVLALFAMVLPLFAGGDPVWAALWLFALCWAYFSTVEKGLGVAGLIVLAALPTLIESASRSLTRPPNAVFQATRAIQERRYDPQAVTELAALADVFEDDAEFHRLLGDAYRTMGFLDSASWAYREGLRIKPKDPAGCLGLGVVHYLQGDFNSAIQVFQLARDSGADPVVANYDLALTFKQTFHFPESDAALEAANQADARRLAALTRETAHDPVVVPFSETDAEKLIARKDPILLLNRGLLPPPLLRERTVTHPLSIAAFLALLAALGHLLLRRRGGPLAVACMKCGRAFCQRCKLSSESQSYCTQCVNIFLKKDMVAIDMQLSKRRQLATRQKLRLLKVRFLDLILPGMGLTISGRPAFGLPLALAALIASVAGIAWFPWFVGPTLGHVSVTPVVSICALIWLTSAVIAQTVPRQRR